MYMGTYWLEVFGKQCGLRNIFFFKDNGRLVVVTPDFSLKHNEMLTYGMIFLTLYTHFISKSLVYDFFPP